MEVSSSLTSGQAEILRSVLRCVMLDIAIDGCGIPEKALRGPGILRAVAALMESFTAGLVKPGSGFLVDPDGCEACGLVQAHPCPAWWPEVAPGVRHVREFGLGPWRDGSLWQADGALLVESLNEVLEDCHLPQFRLWPEDAAESVREEEYVFGTESDPRYLGPVVEGAMDIANFGPARLVDEAWWWYGARLGEPVHPLGAPIACWIRLPWSDLPAAGDIKQEFLNRWKREDGGKAR